MPPTPNLDASVVVPTHNRRDLIRRCLRSLEAQTHDLSAFEVVIIDDGSTDGTGEMLEQLETPLRLRVLQLGAVGQSAARNAAIEASESPLCILLDDDVIASPELVAEHVKAHRANDRIAGIGALAQESFEGRDWFVDAFARGWARHYARLEHEPARWPDCYGGNFSAGRAALLEVGGFATDLAVSKDIEIGFRLEEHGYQPTYIPLARAIHDDQKPRDRLLADVDRAGIRLPGSRRTPPEDGADPARLLRGRLPARARPATPADRPALPAAPARRAGSGRADRARQGPLVRIPAQVRLLARRATGGGQGEVVAPHPPQAAGAGRGVRPGAHPASGEDARAAGRGAARRRAHSRALRTGRGAPPGLDWFGGGGPRELVLRRLLLALRVPARLLALAASLVPGGERRTAAERLVSRYAFWRGVRTATDRAAWSRLTRACRS